VSPRSDRAGFGKQPKGYSRRDRVGHQIQQVLADHLERTADESSSLITITGVDCSPDLRNATVFYTVYGDEKAEKHAAKELAARQGELRTVIAKSVRMKITPELTFEQDTSIERGNRIERLLYELRTGKREEDDDQ
jgi:ribosome-binding factor A